MALQAGLDRDAELWPHIKQAADFLVSRGPAFGSERWEEQSGFSPSTIAAEIAGLVAAGVIAERNGDSASSRVYLATADDFARRVEEWTVTTTGPYAPRYFIRLSRSGDPNTAESYNLGNGSISADQRDVVDAGFLELTRLGVLASDDPDVLASLDVVDDVIRVETAPERASTATAPSWRARRTDTATAGNRTRRTARRADAHGRRATPAAVTSGPSSRVSGRSTPSSSATETALGLRATSARGRVGGRTGARAELGEPSAAPVALWQDPTVASIGFLNGEAAGSATPLTWAQAQLVRLLVGLAENASIEQPAEVRERYVDNPPPAAVPVTITAPADGSLVSTPTTTVTGTTEPGATVDVSAYAGDADGATTTATTTAGADGMYSAEVPTPFGTNYITVAATTDEGTGRARVVVVSDFIEGTDGARRRRPCW